MNAPTNGCDTCWSYTVARSTPTRCPWCVAADAGDVHVPRRLARYAAAKRKAAA